MPRTLTRRTRPLTLTLTLTLTVVFSGLLALVPWGSPRAMRWGGRRLRGRRRLMGRFSTPAKAHMPDETTYNNHLDKLAENIGKLTEIARTATLQL